MLDKLSSVLGFWWVFLWRLKEEVTRGVSEGWWISEALLEAALHATHCLFHGSFHPEKTDRSSPYACSLLVVFLWHIPRFQCHFPCLFSALLLHILHFSLRALCFPCISWPLCRCVELQVSVCVPAWCATGLATEQAQGLLPRTGASYRVQLICSNLLLWEVAAPGSTLLLYFSACSFLETSFYCLHSRIRIQVAPMEISGCFVYKLVRSYVFSSMVWMAVFNSLSGLGRQLLEAEWVGVWGSGQVWGVSLRHSSQQHREELFDTFSPLTKYYFMAGASVSWWPLPEYCQEYLEISSFILADNSWWAAGNRPHVEKRKRSGFFEMCCPHPAHSQGSLCFLWPQVVGLSQPLKWG